jgi:hypothetical protein
MSDLWLIVSIALGSFALRSSFTALAPNHVLPDPVQRVIGQLKPSAFAALATTALATHGHLSALHILAIISVALVARRASLLSAFGLGGVVLIVGKYFL